MADAVLEKEYVVHPPFWASVLIQKCRKDKEMGVVFGHGFSWPAAIDAAADVYNGVRIPGTLHWQGC